MAGLETDKTAIVIIAYNREKPLRRLLSSVKTADYPDKCEVPLIISIDKSDNGEVLKAASEFDWKYGEKRILTHDKRLGLRRHVLECGDHSGEYGNVILLEDDLFVMPDFYNYALAALEFTACDERIGGVSLYNHLLNVHVREPFFPVEDGFDNYYLQLASSWGQAYTAGQWKGFKEWLEKRGEGSELCDTDIPENVSSWSDSSWLKYNIAYLIEKDMYFLYPRSSLTTNFMSQGEHSGGESCDLQVPLGVFRGVRYRFGKLYESRSRYDAFFENTALKELMAQRYSLKPSDICIDLYGYRRKTELKGRRYLLSSRALPFKILDSYARTLRPLDCNIIYNITGEDFFLYDTDTEGKAPGVDKAERYLYNYRALSSARMLAMIKRTCLKKLFSKTVS